MSDSRLPAFPPNRIYFAESLSGAASDSPTYRIMRKGSRYNILGPHGRIYTKYQSASVAGPRWEELTQTPWPYASSAYERGLRLWELGLITRDQVGKKHIVLKRDQPTPENTRAKSPVLVLIPPTTRALPTPRLNLEEHERLMSALRRNPTLLFHPKIQQALRNEVEYHRPLAQWARHLLELLARYEKRQRQRALASRPDSATITAQHIAWQTERQQAVAHG